MNSSGHAVTFRTTADKGIGPNKAYPFIYSFVNKEVDGWDTAKGTLAGNMTGLGVNVPALSNAQHVILLDQNCNFKLLSIRYCAYYINAVAGTYEWFDNEAGWRYEYADGEPVGTPLVHFIRASVSIPHNSRYLYGGMNPAPTAANFGLMRIPLDAIQGQESGIGQVRIEYLLPQSGQVLFEFQNTHRTKDLIVAGCMYGMKVRI